MYVIDPDTTPADAGTPDAAAAAAEAPADDGAGMLDAITADLPEGAQTAADATPDDAIPGTNEAAAAERGEKPDGEEGKPAPDKAAKPEDDEIAKEADALGLKGKSNERFREMAAEIKELAPIRDALKAAGIEDVAQLPQLAKRAKDGDDLVGMVTETGASPEQFGMTLDYLKVVAAANKGDRTAGEKAWDMWLSEGKALAAGLGKEMPGVHDPIAAHADLVDAIENGDMTRAAALEVAQARTTANAIAQRQQVTEQQTQAQHAQQQAIDNGVAALQAWEAPRKADPAYLALRPALNAKVKEIRQKYPPSLWAEATDLAFQALAAQAKPAAPAKPVPGPVRSGGPRPVMVPTTDDPLEAMMQGIAAATP